MNAVRVREPAAGIAERMRIRQYVQSGQRKTVRQVVQRFGNTNLMRANFGRMFAHARNWEIDGYIPDPNDVQECVGKEDNCAASIRIGDTIIRCFIDSIISAPRPWPWGRSHSQFLKPVQQGRCSCGEDVTDEMQNGLKLSDEVRCKRCTAWLFGHGQ